MTAMDDPRCQSCATPLEGGWFGSNADGSKNRDYCWLCYRRGVFTEPELTLETMLERSIRQGKDILRYAEPKAKAEAERLLADLKRWQR